MINISIGNTTDDINVLNKTFVSRQITGEIFNPCNLLQPRLIVSRETFLSSDNYCYIPYFNRYYFISNPVFDGQRVFLDCTVDVLMSNKNQLQNCDCTVIRSESTGITDIDDNKLPINPHKIWLDGKYLPNNPLSSDIGLNYFLAINGGTTNAT